MATSSTHLPKPKDWEDFERKMTTLMQEWLADENAQGNGRQGQEQAGVDVYGRRKNGRWVGLQCKKKFGTKVKEEELKAEVEKAATFKPPIKEFILATTAPRDAKIQRVAREITEERRDFSVHVWGWEDIEEKASEFARALRAFDPDYSPILAAQLSDLHASVIALRESIAVRDSLSADAGVTAPQATNNPDESTQRHGQISLIQRLIDDDEVLTAERQLLRIKEADWTAASRSERYRMLVAEANIAIKREQFETAGSLLLQAYDECPEHENAAPNRAVGLLLVDRPDEAATAAQEVLATSPDNQRAVDTLIQARAACDDADPFAGIDAAKQRSPIAYIVRANVARNAGLPDWRVHAAEAHRDHPDDRFLSRFAAEAKIEEALEDAKFFMLGEVGSGVDLRELQWAAGELSQQVERLSALGGSVPTSLAHNAALANRLIGNTNGVIAALRAGAAANPDDADLVEQLALTEARENDPNDAIQRLESIKRGFNGNLTLASAYCAKGRFDEAESLLNALESEAEGQTETFNVLAVKLDWFQRQHRTADALTYFKEYHERHPDALLAKLFLGRAFRLAQDRDSAEKVIDEGIALVTNSTNFLLVNELADEAFRLEKFEATFELLRDRVALDRESEPLSLCIAAAMNGDLLKAAADLLSKVPREHAQDRWFQRVRIILANRVGDPKTLSLLNSFLKAYPNDAEMRLARVAIWQREGATAKIKTDVAAADFQQLEGQPSVIMRFLRACVMFGRPRDGLDRAYHLLLDNWEDQGCHLAFHGLFLANDPIRSVDLFPAKIALDTVFRVQTPKNVKEHRIEQRKPAVFGETWLSPTDEVAKTFLGKAAGDTATLQTARGSEEYTVLEVKSVYLDTFHKSISSFNARFPSSKAMFQLEINEKADDPLEQLREVVKQAAERDRQLLELYRDTPVPLAWLATMLGKDEIECALGVPAEGIKFKVCRGTHAERQQALETVQGFDGRGVVIDAITATVIKRLGVFEAVTAVCGPLHTTQSTIDLLAERYLQTSGDGMRSSGTLGWRDGRLLLTEITEEQWHDIQRVRKDEWEWARENLVVLPALPKTEPDGDARKTIEVVGTEAVAPVLAANGSDLPLLSDDFGLRLWAADTMNVPGVWLQPCLMIARDRNHLSMAEYQKAVNDMVDAGFDYISLDAGCLVDALRRSDYDVGKLDQHLGLLAGETADLPTNLGVVAKAIDDLRLEPCPHYKWLRFVSEVARQLTYPRWAEVTQILAALVTLCQRGKPLLREHLREWLRGHSMGTSRQLNTSLRLTTVGTHSAVGPR